MHGIAVAVLSEDRERLTVLQTRLETTNLGRTNYIHLGFPMGPTGPVLRQIQDARSEIVLVDIDSHDPQRAIRDQLRPIHSHHRSRPCRGVARDGAARAGEG